MKARIQQELQRQVQLIFFKLSRKERYRTIPLEQITDKIWRLTVILFLRDKYTSTQASTKVMMMTVA